MSSRLRLQKSKSQLAKQKAEQQEKREQEAYRSLQTAQPGDAVTVAGLPPDGLVPAVQPSSDSPRGPKRPASKALISDSESEGSPDTKAAAEEPAGWSAASEANESSSSSDSSMNDSDEDDSPVQKKSRKTTGAAAKHITQSRSKAALAKQESAKKPGKTTSQVKRKNNQKQNKPDIQAAAKRQPSTSAQDTDDALPVRCSGAAAPKPAVAERMPPEATNTTVPEQASAGAKSNASCIQSKPLPAIPASKPYVSGGTPASRTPGHMSKPIIISHMSKPIIINETGPAFRVAGLRRPGGKPLHQIQPQA